MIIKDILNKIGDKLPDEVKIVSQEARNAMRDLMQEKLQQLNLVTRQEFDAQTQALLAAQARIEELIQQVAILEGKLFNHKGTDKIE